MVTFWQIQDTVVNCHNAGETFEIILAENRTSGTWISLRNFHTREIMSGYEVGFQRLGYVAYRKETFIEAIALR